MANASDGLFKDYLRERFTQTTSAAGVTACASASGVANGNGNLPNNMPAKSRAVVESLTFSAANKTAAGVTVTVSVRDASIAGQVLNSWDFLVAAGGVTNDCYAQLNVAALRGHDLVAEMGTPNASLSYRVSIAGWFEVSQVD